MQSRPQNRVLEVPGVAWERHDPRRPASSPISERNETRSAPAHAGLTDMLWEQVRRCPDHPAVVQGDEQLSLRQLAERSSDLAAQLMRLGVGAGDLVGLFVEPSIELMVGAWGILLSGGCYLPLSPDYPEERLRTMVEDAHVGLVFCQDQLRTRLADWAPRDLKIVTPGDVEEQARGRTQPAVGGGPRPEDLAYVIYTSGSSGRPKGVMIEHRGIVSQMDWLRTSYGLGRDSIVLQKTPISFDAAQWEILAPACGSTVVMADPGAYRDPKRLIGTILEHGVTVLQCVPTLLQALLDTGTMERCTSLTHVFSGGEILSRNLARQCLQTLPGCELVNLYGPTECTINATSHPVDRATVDRGNEAIPIGRPVHNTEVHILDDRLSPVPAGETGELYISGIQLARGYLHRPDLTSERFVANPLNSDPPHRRLYRTGDLARWNEDGTVQFIGRADSQVKLRGYRVELDEVRLAIQNHDWVRSAAVVVSQHPRTGNQSLRAYVELSPREAVLMDEGDAGAHHRSKESRLQVRAQLSNSGCREPEELAGRIVVDLPGAEPTPEQKRLVFARKTYRFYEGGAVGATDIPRLLEPRARASASRELESVSRAELGSILRYFGQFLSPERLLPKYGYASPGALYATQLYLEVNRVAGLQRGYYYYHPLQHQLVLIHETDDRGPERLGVHFTGKKRAIEPVYRTNIQEVLEIEAGHMVGLFDEILPAHGLGMTAGTYSPAVRDHLEVADEDYYLGSFEMVPASASSAGESLDVYVQSHPGKIADLPAGQYLYRDGTLERISDELVTRRHVVAINQHAYERSSFGISLVSRSGSGWLQYVDLGRRLSCLQLNDSGIGLMSCGYSSETGHPLPAAVRLQSILEARGREAGASYFCIGGPVSNEQLRSEGMKEDAVHMCGPAEIIRTDLARCLPDYMVPDRVIVLDRLPLTANGKIDQKALMALEAAKYELSDRPLVAPRTRTEERIGDIWRQELGIDAVSVDDDFFESGGNSLSAVRIITRINDELWCSLSLRALFESPTIEKLASAVDGHLAGRESRLVPLQVAGTGAPVYCWPGLGGYPMNLRPLAGHMGDRRPFYGVQAYGIDPNETPYRSLGEMAAADVAAIRRLQPSGPYTLWGYSFGARVAFEAAYQLERSGERVEDLILIAPGAPRVAVGGGPVHGREPAYDDRTFVAILYSVFAGSLADPGLEGCLKVARDDESFASFVNQRLYGFGADLIRRIAGVVRTQYRLGYTPEELEARRIRAPITIFRARGDEDSFLEHGVGLGVNRPNIVLLDIDHYGVLKEPGVGELARRIDERTYQSQSPDASEEITTMPHVNIKHFPVTVTDEQMAELVAAVTIAVQSAFGCAEGVISIATEPVEKELWNERVYLPEIVNRGHLLRKLPNY
jgi:indigoidine synthase